MKKFRIGSGLQNFPYLHITAGDPIIRDSSKKEIE